MKTQTTWNRRSFLMSVAGASAALALNPFSAWAFDDVDPRVARLVRSTMGIDSHNHIDLPLLAADVPGPKIDLAGDMKKSGLSAICATFALDYQHLSNPGEAYDRFQNWFNSMDQQLELNGMKRALTLKDLQDAHQINQPIIVQSIEGAHFLEGHLERMETAYHRGLRHFGLLHDSDASTPLGDVYTNSPQFGGLTDFGAQVIKECNRLGILIDLAHASPDTVVKALRVSNQPVIFSHTGLDTQLGSNPNMASMMKPRLLSAAHCKVIADVGGVIGVWTHLSDTPLEYAQNIRAMVEVVGADHVCIGTDTKLTPGNRPQGRPGGPGGPRVGERTNLAWAGQTTGFYVAVVEAMLKVGFTEEEIAKIGGGNYCRVFEAATASQA
jgi:membrane dipeptidase